MGDPKAPRFVFWEGKLRPVPDSPLSGITFDLMTFPGKIRAGLGAIGIKPAAPGERGKDFMIFLGHELYLFGCLLSHVSIIQVFVM